jgi:hypothetical protein
MITLSIARTSSPKADDLPGEDGQRYFELSGPFLSHAPATALGRDARQIRATPHYLRAGSRKRERPAGHLHPSLR